MCGIAALLRREGASITDDVIERMTRVAAHRGPDGEGFVRLDAGGTPAADWRFALGHRRLSIIDLSVAGRQPMVYRDRYWISYNGEVYNYLELRRELEQLGHFFCSNSDTEVVLAAFAQWGPECFARMRGMWGLVLVDGPGRRAILSRDRLGIKPLYWHKGANAIAVVSEIKQLREVPWIQLRPDEAALAEYLTRGYEDSARTFFAGVHALAPGSWMEIAIDDLRAGDPQSYWHPERVQVAVHAPVEASRAFAETLRDSVRLHLRSDVPVGCALSGGLDSSSVVALAQRLKNGAGRAMQTFTAIFPGDKIDERAWAERVVRHTHSEPHFVEPTATQLLEEFDRFCWIHDEPVGHASQYAGWCVARLTRTAGVPVTLNGQGGDEVFSGYWQSYLMYLRGLARRGRLLALGRHFAGALLPSGNPELPRQVPVMWRRYRARNGAGGSERLARVMEMNQQERRVFEIREMFLPRLLKWDDRNFMAFSVEGRYPFLDHELIELVLSFAPEVLYARGWTKEPLRTGLSDVLPREILRRRNKLGFETPQDRWLCGPLRSSVEDWLRKDAPIWRWVQPAEARALADTVWKTAGRRDEPGQALFRLFAADRWMRNCTSLA